MEWTVVVSVVGVLSGMALGWMGRTRSIRQDAAQDAGTVATLQNNVEYIRRGVDDIKVDMRVQNQRMDSIAERLTREEESNKQAHKRIDELRDLIK